jgi:predicted flap endonuclease-1-like 5' DNA nuclease
MPKELPVAWWKVMGGALGAVLLALCLALPAMAAEPPAPALPALPERDGQMLRAQGPRQVLRDDLTVERGQVIDDDVFVYSGDVEVKDGGRITGDLVVFSGNIALDQGSVVEGDVTSYSGNVKVAGQIEGDFAVWSGNVELASTAHVNGDISVLSGSIERDEGASVDGNVVQGPSFRFPGSDAPEAPRAPAGISVPPAGPSFFGRLINFVGRLFAAALMTALVMLLVGGLFYIRPQLIADTRRYLKDQLALSAVVGVLANLVVLFLAGLLAITVCLLPLALVPMLILLAVNVVGWAVISQIVGERIVTAVKQDVQPALTILVGALFLTGICALLWAFGGCFRPLAFLLIFAASSLGTGAVLVPWINKRRGLGGSGNGGGNFGGDVPPRGPAPTGPVSVYNSPVATDVTTPTDHVTAEEINAMTGQAGASASKPSPDAGEVVEQNVAEPIDYVTAEEINETQEQSATTAPKSRSRGKKGTDATSSSASSSLPEGTVEQDVAEPLDYVTAQEVITTDTLTEGDDFLQIKGIGPSYARRLKDGGFATFAQLAAATPEDVAAAIGWPVDRVRRAEVIDQAKMLVQRS